MNSEVSPTSSDKVNGDEQNAALFAHLVMQQANMAMMLLGKAPHPESGEVMKDLDSAKLFIDLLEMLQVKTKGNLAKDEENLLKQSLMSLRLAFVEAVESGPQPAPAKESAKGSEPPKAADSAKVAGATPVAEEEEHRKKFSKKY
jgi:hypothetical protein